MQIHTEPFEDFAILHLRGEFDGFYCARFQQEIAGLMTAGLKHVGLNLRKIRFINSTALGAIIRASKALKSEGGKLVVIRPSRICRDIMNGTIVPSFKSKNFSGGIQAGVRALDAMARGKAIPRPPRPASHDWIFTLRDSMSRDLRATMLPRTMLPRTVLSNRLRVTKFSLKRIASRAHLA